MKAKRTTIAILLGLFTAMFGATLHAGDWEKAPIENLGGLQNANTDLKKPTIMELGRRGGADGHPGAWREMGVDCGEHPSSGDHWCNIQLEIIFSKSRSHERVKIQILDAAQSLASASCFVRVLV